MKLLGTYQNLRRADIDRQFLSREGIGTILVASDGRTIDKWTDYETNFGDRLSGSLYVEDDVFDRALPVYKKRIKKGNHFRIFNNYLVPLIIQISMWSSNLAMSENVKEFLLSYNLQIKYTGAIAYTIFLLVLEAEKFTRKRGRSKLWNEQIDEKNEVRDFLTKILMACLLFVLAYFSS